MYLAIFVVAIAASGTLVSSRLRIRLPKNLFISVFEWFGELGIFCMRLLRASLAPPYEFWELLRQCDEIGSKSLPLIALAGAATGVVMSLQTRDSLVRFGAKSFLPAVIVFSLIKESGPIITGLMVSGRVGAGIGAQLGSMKVTEQIDAMEASAIDPFKFLVATRVLACVVMVPLLTLRSAPASCACSRTSCLPSASMRPTPRSRRGSMPTPTCCSAISFRPPSRRWSSVSSSELQLVFKGCERKEALREWEDPPQVRSCCLHSLSCWLTWFWFV